MYALHCIGEGDDVLEKKSEKLNGMGARGNAAEGRHWIVLSFR